MTEHRAEVPRRTLSHYRGCLLGGAVGDALGAPVEFEPLGAIRARLGPAGVRGYLAQRGRSGAITDDTQMTLFTAQGLLQAHNRWLERGVVDPARMVYLAYLDWLDTQGEQPAGRQGRRMPRGWLASETVLRVRRAPGATCLSALRSGEQGTRARAINDSKGCGTVMRVAPVGLTQHVDHFDLGCRTGAITHGHPTGQLAAGFLAQLLADLVCGATLERAIGQGLDRLRRERDAAETIAAVEGAAVAAGRGQATPEAIERLGQGWVAEEALAIALYAALVASGFEEGVLLAVNHSGDSDSTGSIAGQILGLLNGEESIPSPWLEGLEAREIVATVAEDLWRHFGDCAPAPAGASDLIGGRRGETLPEAFQDEDRYPC